MGLDLLKKITENKHRCSTPLCFRQATKFLRARVKGTSFSKSIGYCDKCAEKVHKQIMASPLYNNYEEDTYKG